MCLDALKILMFETCLYKLDVWGVANQMKCPWYNTVQTLKLPPKFDPRCRGVVEYCSSRSLPHHPQRVSNYNLVQFRSLCTIHMYAIVERESRLNDFYLWCVRIKSTLSPNRSFSWFNFVHHRPAEWVFQSGIFSDFRGASYGSPKFATPKIRLV